MKLARIVVAAHALWLVASRPCLPVVLDWPTELWAGTPAGISLRYLWLFTPLFEHLLYAALALALILAIFGIATRASCISAALLLYHFAPLEDVFTVAYGPYVRGLTADVLVLAILGFAPPQRRWPLTLLRCVVASQYVFSTVSKLHVAGMEWFRGENIRDLAIMLDGLHAAPRAHTIIDHPWLASAVALAWLLISLGMAATPFFRHAAMIVVPLAALAQIAAVPLLGIVFLGAPLLLVFVDQHDAVVSG